MENKLHLPRQVPRDLYVRTAKVIELLGGKWNRSLAAHVFDGDCAERVDEAVIAGEVTDFKKLYQFYWLKQLNHEVEDLPEGTFKCRGTNVRTALPTIRH